MLKNMYLKIVLLAAAVCLTGFFQEDSSVWDLSSISPADHSYTEATECLNCKQNANDIMSRTVGADLEGETIARWGKGWLDGPHANSLNHEVEFNMSCAWCHAPTRQGVTRDKDTTDMLERKDLQGVTCTACHPGMLRRDLRKSLLSNFKPGSDPTVQDSYIFRDKSNPAEFNAQCGYCHYEAHELLVPAKVSMLESGALRCIDCHMAGYDIAGTRNEIERFHNMQVESNLPFSCSGAFGTTTTCHPDATKEWMLSKLPEVKGKPIEWSAYPVH